ncbi:hypothetical protein NOF04DRAFT_19837 [Fusarium oxysporum II5]|uniref:Uncharacterized protein n=2 Tax=Fusarium oxysporum species complex TaxID=171631 RepID=X0K4M2_FUSO5|nr:uncharacterized protein FOIG_05372 [Fusarium odoratissimum NRRL 54006]EXM03682.1 hypothetical protein FOIG_05372 [Fusarium odoratissimum NRRL 54006]KAK2131915.1 hypothetical protein NOF04DRAFT_19837 [Fusarium oxysporum II5]TXC09683.1 hypothetical protein FocTR4_00005832 [Fusarium oxysporum f. sp. cubense]
MDPENESQFKTIPASSQPDQRSQPWKLFLPKEMFEKEEVEDLDTGNMGKDGLVRHKVEADSKSLGKHWLTIFESVEDGYHITDSIPSAPMGSVLITTRNENVGFQLASNTLRVPPFTVEEGTTLLLTIIQRDNYSKEEREAASNLSRQLDGLPLAVNLMASQMVSRQMSPIQFIKSFERYSERLFEKGRSQNAYYKKG